MRGQTGESMVAVRFKGDGLDPGSLTAILGVEPTNAHAKGDVEKMPSGREIVRKIGLWSLTIEFDVHSELSTILEDMVSKLLSSGGGLNKLPGVDHAYVDVYLSQSMEKNGGGVGEFDFSGELVILLGRLGLPVKFTVAVVPD